MRKANLARWILLAFNLQTLALFTQMKSFLLVFVRSTGWLPHQIIALAISWPARSDWRWRRWTIWTFAADLHIHEHRLSQLSKLWFKIRIVTCQSKKCKSNLTTAFPPCIFKYKFQFCFPFKCPHKLSETFCNHTYSEMSPAVNKNKKYGQPYKLL